MITIGSLLSVAAWSSPAAGAPSDPTVSVATNATFGQILTDAQGFALYTFSGDDSGIGTCTDGCATVWPPLTVPAGTAPNAGSGVTGTVAAVLQPDGSYQVTYDGSPLYSFVGDSSPGQVTGNGTSGFSVVKVSMPPPPPTSTVPASSTSTGSPVAPASQTTTPSSTSPTSPPEPAAPATASAGTPSSSAGTLASTGVGPSLQLAFVLGVAFIVTGGSLFAAPDPLRRRRRYRPTQRP